MSKNQQCCEFPLFFSKAPFIPSIQLVVVVNTLNHEQTFFAILSYDHKHKHCAVIVKLIHH